MNRSGVERAFMAAGGGSLDGSTHHSLCCSATSSLAPHPCCARVWTNCQKSRGCCVSHPPIPVPHAIPGLCCLAGPMYRFHDSCGQICSAAVCQEWTVLPVGGWGRWLLQGWERMVGGRGGGDLHVLAEILHLVMHTSVMLMSHARTLMM